MTKTKTGRKKRSKRSQPAAQPYAPIVCAGWRPEHSGLTNDVKTALQKMRKNETGFQDWSGRYAEGRTTNPICLDFPFVVPSVQSKRLVASLGVSWF